MDYKAAQSEFLVPNQSLSTQASNRFLWAVHSPRRVLSGLLYQRNHGDFLKEEEICLVLETTHCQTHELSFQSTRIFNIWATAPLQLPATPIMHDIWWCWPLRLLLLLAAACWWTESLKGFTSLFCVNNGEAMPAFKVPGSSDTAMAGTSLKSVLKRFLLERKLTDVCWLKISNRFLGSSALGFAI